MGLNYIVIGERYKQCILNKRQIGFTSVIGTLRKAAVILSASR